MRVNDAITNNSWTSQVPLTSRHIRAAKGWQEDILERKAFTLDDLRHDDDYHYDDDDDDDDPAAKHTKQIPRHKETTTKTLMRSDVTQFRVLFSCNPTLTYPVIPTPIRIGFMMMMIMIIMRRMIMLMMIIMENMSCNIPQKRNKRWEGNWCWWSWVSFRV